MRNLPFSRQSRRVFAISAVLSLSLGSSFCGQVFAGDSPSRLSSSANDSSNTLKVLAVGGSSAHGWDAPHDVSYLLRAVTSLAKSSDLALSYDDKTIPGAPAVSVSSQKFGSWLTADHPQIVIISWGILDDVHNHTPLSAFSNTIHDEIQQALAANAQVLVVTPPVVQASVGKLEAEYQTYAAAEHDVVKAIHSSNLYWFNLHQQTYRYILTHKSSLSGFCANGWHPNGRGQSLGGQILYKDVQKTWKSGLHLT